MTLSLRHRAGGEALLVGVLAVAGACVVAQELADRGVVAPSAVAAAADAWLMRSGASGALGSDGSPVLGVLTLPYSALDAIPLLPSLLLGAAIVAFVHAALAVLSVPVLLRWVASAAVALNPAWLYATATGVASVGGALAVLVACCCLVCWLRTRTLLWLPVASVALALGVLTWYSTLAWAVAVVVMLSTSLVLSRRSGGEVTGTLIMFVLPLLFAVGAWTAVAWTLTGSPPAWLADPAPDTVVPASPGIMLAALVPLVIALAVGSKSVRHSLVPPAAAGIAAAFAVGALGDEGRGAATVSLVLVPAFALIVAGSTEPRGRVGVCGWLAVCAAIMTANAALFVSMRSDASQPTAQRFAHALAGDDLRADPPEAVRIGRWLARFSSSEEVELGAVDRATRNVVAFAARSPRLASGVAIANPAVRVVYADQPPGEDRWRPFTAGGLAVEAGHRW